MDLNEMLAELKEERNRLEEAITALERLAQGSPRGAGRPLAWIQNTPRRRGRPPGRKDKPNDNDSFR
jgi:hypothetical protein